MTAAEQPAGALGDAVAASEVSEALHRWTCADPWDACCWAGEDPDLTDCHDETGAWRETGLEGAITPLLAARLAAVPAAVDERAGGACPMHDPAVMQCPHDECWRSSPPRCQATETSPDAVSFIGALVNAWDCCGTCAGGVLAARDRARDLAQTLRDAEVLILGLAHVVCIERRHLDRDDEGYCVNCLSVARHIYAPPLLETLTPATPPTQERPGD